VVQSAPQKGGAAMIAYAFYIAAATLILTAAGLIGDLLCYFFL